MITATFRGVRLGESHAGWEVGSFHQRADFIVLITVKVNKIQARPHDETVDLRPFASIAARRIGSVHLGFEYLAQLGDLLVDATSIEEGAAACTPFSTPPRLVSLHYLSCRRIPRRVPVTVTRPTTPVRDDHPCPNSWRGSTRTRRKNKGGRRVFPSSAGLLTNSPAAHRRPE